MGVGADCFDGASAELWQEPPGTGQFFSPELIPSDVVTKAADAPDGSVQEPPLLSPSVRAPEGSNGMQ